MYIILIALFLGILTTFSGWVITGILFFAAATITAIYKNEIHKGPQ